MFVSGADVHSGMIFCAECDDFIQNKATEDIYHLVMLAAEERSARFACKLTSSCYSCLFIHIFQLAKSRANLSSHGLQTVQRSRH